MSLRAWGAHKGLPLEDGQNAHCSPCLSPPQIKRHHTVTHNEGVELVFDVDEDKPAVTPSPKKSFKFTKAWYGGRKSTDTPRTVTWAEDRKPAAKPGVMCKFGTKIAIGVDRTPSTILGYSDDTFLELDESIRDRISGNVESCLAAIKKDLQSRWKEDQLGKSTVYEVCLSHFASKRSRIRFDGECKQYCLYSILVHLYFDYGLTKTEVKSIYNSDSKVNPDPEYLNKLVDVMSSYKEDSEFHKSG